MANETSSGMTDARRLKRAHKNFGKVGESLRKFVKRLWVEGDELAPAALRWLVAKYPSRADGVREASR